MDTIPRHAVASILILVLLTGAFPQGASAQLARVTVGKNGSLPVVPAGMAGAGRALALSSPEGGASLLTAPLAALAAPAIDLAPSAELTGPLRVIASESGLTSTVLPASFASGPGVVGAGKTAAASGERDVIEILAAAAPATAGAASMTFERIYSGAKLRQDSVVSIDLPGLGTKIPAGGPGQPGGGAESLKPAANDAEAGAVTLKLKDPLSRAKLIARFQRLAVEAPASALAEAAALLRDPAEQRWDVRVSALRALKNADAGAVVDLLVEAAPNFNSYSLRREALIMLNARLAGLADPRRARALEFLQAASVDKNWSVRAAARAFLKTAGVEPQPEPVEELKKEEKKPLTFKERLQERLKARYETSKPLLGKIGFAVILGWAAFFIFAVARGFWLQYHFPDIKEPFSLAFQTVAGPIVVAMVLAIPTLAVIGGVALMQHMSAKKQFMNVDKPKERFSDIAGIDESMVEIQEVLSFLKNPAQHGQLGGRPPRGVLLVGPPGTGKTLMAKALAGESGASFITATGSEFVEMYVGVGAARVRAKFALARQHTPAILFIDEFDAVGGKRSEGRDGGAQEHLQTINALLAEMDGFHNGQAVIVIAATNRVEALDPAILRPGRFDRKVHVELPDMLGREAILQIHAEKVKLGPDVDLRQIAAPTRTGGMSGAFLANIINEAANMAERRGAKIIEMVDLIEASDRESMGQARSILMSPEEKQLTAYHEAGHALVEIAQGGEVDKATIIPRGTSGGHVRAASEEDKGYHAKSGLKKRLAMAMGGIVAEQMLRGKDDHTSGPSSDLENVTATAEVMVTRYGMGRRTGYRVVEPKPGVDRSQRLLRDVERDVQDLIAEAESKARSILTKRKADWEKLAKTLLAEETLSGDQIKALLDDRPGY